MVSGRYVAPSFFQYAAPLAQLYIGKEMGEKSDKALLDLAEQLRKGKEQETKAIMEQLRPREVQTEMACAIHRQCANANSHSNHTTKYSRCYGFSLTISLWCR